MATGIYIRTPYTDIRMYVHTELHTVAGQDRWAKHHHLLLPVLVLQAAEHTVQSLTFDECTLFQTSDLVLHCAVPSFKVF